MRVSINQPAYLPWAGYFDRIAASDVHIVLDHVQFEKNSFVNRNKIRTPQGWTWLTVPVTTKGRFGALPINELEMAEAERWPKKHWSALQANYAKSASFETHRGFFEAWYGGGFESPLFLPVMMRFIGYACECLGIETRIVMSSELAPDGTKSDLVLELCQKVEASEYLSGPLGRDYLDRGPFEAAGIGVTFHDYAPRPYAQRFEGFEPGLSIVDMMMNVDVTELPALIAAGRQLSDA